MLRSLVLDEDELHALSIRRLDFDGGLVVLMQDEPDCRVRLLELPRSPERQRNGDDYRIGGWVETISLAVVELFAFFPAEVGVTHAEMKEPIWHILGH